MTRAEDMRHRAIHRLRALTRIRRLARLKRFRAGFESHRV